MVGNSFFVSNFGKKGSIKSEAAGIIRTSDAESSIPDGVTIIEDYHYPNGVLVYTEVEAVNYNNNTGQIEARLGNATVSSSDVGDYTNILLYTLTVVNQGTVFKEIDLSFSLPSGRYVFLRMFPPGSANPSPIPEDDILRWDGYNAPPGTSKVSFLVEIQ